MSVDSRNPPFKPGDKVLRIEIQRLIGKGGQGFVYEGMHEFLEHPVAVKVIPNSTEKARDLRQRAKMEARILFRLRHPNILQVFDADVTDSGVVCIVMEMLKGRSIRSMLRELKRINVDEALLIGAQIAEGVQAAHQLQAIHRDLKPENVYIEPGNVVKVLDFGIAKITGLGAVTTQQNLIQGTVQYMSPEHLQGRTVTPRSDVFALGCMLYELIAGCTPAVMGSESITMHVAGWNQIMLMPPSLDKVVANVPGYVGRAIQRMLAKEPPDRPATMAEVASELRALYARFTNNVKSIQRELWHEGAGAAPLQANLCSPIATTTTPDIAGPLSASDLVPPHEQPISDSTGPLPLLVRQASRQPNAPAEVPNFALMLKDLPRVHPAAPEPLAQADVARASIVVAQPNNRLRASDVSVPVTVGVKSQTFKIAWQVVMTAILTGILFGGITLLALAWSSNRNSKTVEPSAEAAFAVNVPQAVTAAVDAATIGSIAATSRATATALPVPAAPSAVPLPPQPPAAPRQALPAAANAGLSATSGVASTKPRARKAKASGVKLPFSADDLTF